MHRIIQLYKDAFGGLSREAWMLALVMLINRSGSMVLPFLTVYCTTFLNFSVREAGIVMTMYGLGSMVGSYSGGWLADKFGHFRVQTTSLIFGGALFFGLAELSSFYYMSAYVFFLSVVVEWLRPANSISVAYYARPENITRAFSLNRMAINLGFSLGPALGGLLAGISYRLLFYADAVTCITAGIVFYFYFRHRSGRQQASRQTTDVSVPHLPPYRNVPYLVFILGCFGFAVVFFQLFSTLPLYYKEAYAMDISHIGLLLAINGLFVVSLEMIMVHLIGNRFRLPILIAWGCVLTGLSFLMLNWWHSVAWLVLSMALLSIAEILAMPFMTTTVVNMSSPQNRGAYMGLYSTVYSAALVMAPYLGTSTIARFGFTWLWMGCFAVCALVALLFLWINRRVKQREQQAVRHDFSAQVV